MKVLVLGRTIPRSAEQSVARALTRLGHRVVAIHDRKVGQFGDRVAAAWLGMRIRAFQPDLVFFGKALGISPETLREVCRGRRSAMWYHDIRIPPDETIVARARVVDTVFLVPGGQCREYEALGVRRALFLPEAVDPTFQDRPAPPDAAFASDVAFIGTGYDEYRADLLMRLSRDFRIRVWGPGWERWSRDLDWAGRPVHGLDFARVCSSTKVVLGLDNGETARTPVYGYSSDRMWKTIAVGGFYLGPGTPGVRDVLLRDGVHCAFHADEEELRTKLDLYLGDDSTRDRIRRAGQEFVVSHHTFDHRVQNILHDEPFRNPLDAQE